MGGSPRVPPRHAIGFRPLHASSAKRSVRGGGHVQKTARQRSLSETRAHRRLMLMRQSAALQEDGLHAWAGRHRSSLRRRLASLTPRPSSSCSGRTQPCMVPRRMHISIGRCDSCKDRRVIGPRRPGLGGLCDGRERRWAMTWGARIGHLFERTLNPMMDPLAGRDACRPPTHA